MALADPHRPHSRDRFASDEAGGGDCLQALTEAALAHGDVQAILPEVLDQVREVFRADSAILLLADDAQRTLTIAATAGLLKDDLEVGLVVPVGSGVAGRIAHERRPVALETLAGHDVISPVVREKVESLLGVPLVVDSRLFGVLHVGSHTRRRFSEQQLSRLQGLADRVALALDHARLYRLERTARGEAARAERRFRDLVHSLDAIVWEANASDWRYTFVSRRAEKILGYPIDQWLDTPDFWLKIVHPDDRAELVRRRREIVEKGRGATFEYRVHAADGRTLWMRGMTDVVRDLAGVPRQVRGLMLDITQRRQAEEDALRLAAIVESSDDAIISKDLHGIIRSWNNGARKMYGYEAEEALGKHISLLTPMHLRDEIGEIMAKLRAGERISHLETQRRRKDGEIIDVSLSISPILDPERKNIIGASTISREVTDLKRAERTLRTTEKLAATGRLAASIAHEINNPMASVTNLLYLLQHHPGLDTLSAEYVKLAQEELARVTHIVRQMLGFYRESEAPIAVNLKDVIENVLTLYGRRLSTSQIEVERRYHTEATVRGFPGEIRQVFSNLVVNSIEALGEKGRIRIDIRASRDWSNPQVRGVRVLIADTGPGIPEAARRRIFEPFFTTKGERGTGLGLWVSEGIIRKHGGTMRVRSRTAAPAGANRVLPASPAGQHGTCFSVFLPTELAKKG